jgi:OOP family OmpA-OmpF porin
VKLNLRKGRSFLRREMLRPLILGSTGVPLWIAGASARSVSYIVFFEWDSAEINARGLQIIAQAVRRLGTTDFMGTIDRIEVHGHADRSGPTDYNQYLSQLRAQAALGEVISRGVPIEKTSLQAYGEERPLVVTADGVPELQNRRVELILR